MGVRKLKHSWWIDFQFNRKRIRKRSPVNSRRGANEYELAIRQKIARGEAIGRDQKEQELRFEQFAWKWFDEYVVSNNKHSEQRAKRIVIRSSLIPFFGKMLVADIRAQHI